MKLLIVNNDTEVDADKIFFEIPDVEVSPYGMEVVNDQGGVSLSLALRAALSKFFYHLPVEIKQPTYSGNVVPFKRRIPVVSVPQLPDIS